MKIDTYTKAVLTVIAFCLLIITLKEVNMFPAAYASDTEHKSAKHKNYGLIPVNNDGSINLKLSGEIVDVRLRGIDEASNLRWEAIKVKVQD